MSALIKPRLLGPLLAVVAGFALGGPVVATASASDNSIIKVVDHWSPVVQRDEKQLAKTEHAFKTDRRAGPVIAGLNQEVADLHAFIKDLRAQSASSRRGGQGRDDIAAGSALIAESYASFASELRKAGSKGLSQAQIDANRKVALAGHTKIVAGLKLLEHVS